MELTTSWKEEGRQEGQAQVVLRQLARQWGSLSPDTQDRVRNLSVEQLESLAEALLAFRAPNDLNDWLAGH